MRGCATLSEGFPEAPLDPPEDRYFEGMTRPLQRSLHPSKGLARHVLPGALPGDTGLPVETLENAEDVPWL